VALAPDGRSFASAGGISRGPDGRVRLWAFPSGTNLWTAVGDTNVISLAFSPDGRLVTSGASFGRIRFRSTTDGSETRSILVGSLDIAALVYSPDGRYLAVAPGDSTVRLLDAATGAPASTLTGHTGTVYALAFAPDGRTLASAGDDRTLRLWAF
jgi:WD40 repeat protein